MSKEEEIRIAARGHRPAGFLPRLERLLLAVDESAVGRMAARLAGLLAGAQGMPVTILKLEADLRTAKLAPMPVDEQTHREDAKDAAELEKQKKEDEPGKSGHIERSASKDSTQKEMTGASRARKVASISRPIRWPGKSRQAQKKRRQGGRRRRRT